MNLPWRSGQARFVHGSRGPFGSQCFGAGWKVQCKALAAMPRSASRLRRLLRGMQYGASADGDLCDRTAWADRRGHTICLRV